MSELRRCVADGGKHSLLIKKELIVAQYETPQIGDRIAPSSTEEFTSEKNYFSNRNPFSITNSLWRGEVIATEVGFLNNVSVDFGVYDMRQKNQASKDPAWASAHSQFPADSYGICWLNSLPQADSLAVKSLPSRDGTKNGQKSDYCK
ncbi:hypothetical protein LBMAG05_07530 [Actinomycetes bacterium]|nr:hypothetical protein LBMAG05_07530 [Actinomycetes bacterium]